jgi:hypothetical protein
MRTLRAAADLGRFYTVCMVALDSASTDSLSPRFLLDLRTFLDDAFAGAFTDDD